jgi:hypothetical protein
MAGPQSIERLSRVMDGTPMMNIVPIEQISPCGDHGGHIIQVLASCAAKFLHDHIFRRRHPHVAVVYRDLPAAAEARFVKWIRTEPEELNTKLRPVDMHHILQRTGQRFKFHLTVEMVAGGQECLDLGNRTSAQFDHEIRVETRPRNAVKAARMRADNHVRHFPDLKNVDDDERGIVNFHAWTSVSPGIIPPAADQLSAGAQVLSRFVPHRRPGIGLECPPWRPRMPARIDGRPSQIFPPASSRVRGEPFAGRFHQCAADRLT